MRAHSIGERRVFDFKGIESPQFDIQEWQECNCPDCPSDGHWKTLKETGDESYAHRIVDSHNKALFRSWS